MQHPDFCFSLNTKRKEKSLFWLRFTARFGQLLANSTRKKKKRRLWWGSGRWVKVSSPPPGPMLASLLHYDNIYKKISRCSQIWVFVCVSGKSPESEEVWQVVRKREVSGKEELSDKWRIRERQREGTAERGGRRHERRVNNGCRQKRKSVMSGMRSKKSRRIKGWGRLSHVGKEK